MKTLPRKDKAWQRVRTRGAAIGGQGMVKQGRFRNGIPAARGPRPNTFYKQSRRVSV